MTSYRVVAPYVTLKVKDDTGSSVVRGYYEGGIVDNVADEDQAKAQMDLGLLEKVKASEAPKQDEPPADVPAGNASRDDWAAYATSKGASADETKPVDEGGLKQADLRAKYGK
jgi:hypothetical protein